MGNASVDVAAFIRGEVAKYVCEVKTLGRGWIEPALDILPAPSNVSTM
jgi:hypothetical protein